MREDSVDSGLETESYLDKLATYCVVETTALNVTITPQSAAVLNDIISTFKGVVDPQPFIITPNDLSVINDIGKSIIYY